MSARGDSHNRQPLLKVHNLHVSVGDVEILKGLDLTVGRGEVHAIMGPNGSGKSTLTNALAGKPEYQVTAGEAVYAGKDLLKMSPDQRALEGIFLAFQYPVELPGVRNREFMKAALDAVREHRGLDLLEVLVFTSLYLCKDLAVVVVPNFMKRSVNE